MPSLDVAINSLKAKHGAQQFDEATRKVKRGAKDIDTSTKKSQKSLDGMGASVKRAAIGLVSLVAVYKGVRFAQSAVKEIVAFEMELANVSTMLSDQTMRYLPEYEGALSNLAVRYGQSTATLSKGLYDILSASISAGDALKFLEVAARTAIGGFTSTAVAVDVLTTVINAYGMEAKDAARVADILSATVKLGKITFGELAGSLGKVVAIAAAANLSFEQVSASVATMTRSGIQAEMAMTALKAIVTTFLNPQAEAIKMAKEFGLELNSTTLETIGLTGALEKLRYATGEETAAIFSNVRALLGVEATRKNVIALIEDYGTIVNASALAERNYQKAAKTTAEQIKRSQETWKSIKRDLGKGLLPEVKRVLDDLMFLSIGWKRTWDEMAEAKAVAVKLMEFKLLPTKDNKEAMKILLETGDTVKKINEIYKVFDKTLERTAKRYEKGFEIAPMPVVDEMPLNISKYTEEQKKAGLAVTALFKELKIERDLIGLTTDERERAIKVMEFEAVAKKMGISNIKDLVAMYGKELKSIQEATVEIEYIDDRAAAYRRLYSDLESMGKANFDFQVKLLDQELKEYKKLNIEKALLDEWYNERKAKLEIERDIASDDFFAGFQAQIKIIEDDMLTWGEIGSSVARTMKDDFADALMEMTSAGGDWKSAMEGFVLSIGRTIQRMMAEQIAAQIMVSAVGPLTGGIAGGIGGLFGGGGAAAGGGTAAGGGGMSWTMLGEKGLVLNNGSVTHFAKGDILTRPTIFSMSNGGLGLAGEAGSEAIMPLKRDNQGRLGVRTDGGGETKQPIKIINVMDSSQIEQYLNTGDGERQVINIMRRNLNEVQEISG